MKFNYDPENVYASTPEEVQTSISHVLDFLKKNTEKENIENLYNDLAAVKLMVSADDEGEEQPAAAEETTGEEAAVAPAEEGAGSGT